MENRSEDHPNRFNGNVTLSRKPRRDQHLRTAKMESHLGDMHSFLRNPIGGKLSHEGTTWTVPRNRFLFVVTRVFVIQNSI
jgi:hypothetical protein